MQTRCCELLFVLSLIAGAWLAQDARAAANATAAKSAAAATESKGKKAKVKAGDKPVLAPRKNVTPPNWTIAEFHSEAAGNIFYNNELVKLSFTLAAKDADKPLALKGGTWRIKEIEDQDGWPYHPSLGINHRILESDVALGEGAIAPQSGKQVALTVQWQPTRLGAFGVYLKLDDGSGAEEQMVWGFIVVYPPATGAKPDSPVVFNLFGKAISELGAAHKRLGAKWIRTEIGWSANEPQPGQWTWEGSDEWVKVARDNDLLVMAIMAHAPGWAQPRIEGKIPIYYWKVFPESNATPEHLPQFQEWARRFVDRYKQTVRVGVALNEPWEAGSLSGWHACGAHYREILKSISVGAHAADPTFKILANDSGMNVEDNILVAPGTIDLIDAVSTHTYRSYNAFNVAQYGAYGKPVWDTESWIGVGASDLVRQVAFQLAQGIVKVQPLQSPMFTVPPSHNRAKQAAKQKAAKPRPSAKQRPAGRSRPPAEKKPVGPPKPTEEEKAEAQLEAQKKQAMHAISTLADAATPAYATPTGQALSVLLHFVEDTDFYREARTESLPWMFVFQGRKTGPAPDKNAAIVLGRDERWDNFPWYRIKSDGRLTIADPDGVLTGYDVKGNPLPRSGATLQVPLTTSIYYVVSSKGADDLVERLRAATIQGLEPVQLAVSDFTRPLAENPPVRVTVTNAYNVPVSGSVEVKPPAGWSMASSSQPFAALKPGETVDLSFAVAKTQSLPINRYPFVITAMTDKGKAELKEELSATLLVKGTPPLEGKAEDWQKLGALLVYLAGSTTPADSFLQYAMPFLNLQEQNDSDYVVQFMGMWDEKNFYVLADIKDSTERLRPSMEKGTWYVMHAAPNQWEYWGQYLFPPGGGGDTLDFCFNVLPYGEKQIANYPPAAQKTLASKWRVNIADYEYSLYLGKQNKLAPDDYRKAVEELKQSGKSNVALRPPQLVEIGPPVPEVWRLMAPGLMRHGYLPTSPRAARDQGVVPGAELKVTREGNVWHYRAAIPWSELELVKPLAMEGRSVKFSFLGKNDGRTAVSWSNATRSIARAGQEIMHPTFELNWSPDTEWGFVDLTKQKK